MKPSPQLLKAFMQALRSAIEVEGLTGVAERAGLKPTTVSNWVNRGSVPTLDAAAQVAQAIGFDLGKHNR